MDDDSVLALTQISITMFVDATRKYLQVFEMREKCFGPGYKTFLFMFFWLANEKLASRQLKG